MFTHMIIYSRTRSAKKVKIVLLEAVRELPTCTLHSTASVERRMYVFAVGVGKDCSHFIRNASMPSS